MPAHTRTRPVSSSLHFHVASRADVVASVAVVLDVALVAVSLLILLLTQRTDQRSASSATMSEPPSQRQSLSIPPILTHDATREDGQPPVDRSPKLEALDDVKPQPETPSVKTNPSPPPPFKRESQNRACQHLLMESPNVQVLSS
ncbi:hypothetical protein JVT61DRAFT_4804 [Boletus reticuloceps]|uniref:Uncharacterized protein n=1 Tax=Boletus reticuloceps TaxID=495285 RepID=A0A8I2YLM2_9AGAM|nr:hypothetical protein JVT61DRAFT_4804 [Boletus reticuloceps]